jgi:hypothetical protein
MTLKGRKGDGVRKKGDGTGKEMHTVTEQKPYLQCNFFFQTVRNLFV